MKILSLFDAHGWREDPDYPHQAWQESVAEGQTRDGYARWVLAQCEQDGVACQVEEGLVLEDPPEPGLVAQNADRFPESNWLHEVLDLDTRLGYENWVAHQVEMHEDAEPTPPRSARSLLPG